MVIVLDPLMGASRKIMVMAKTAADTSVWLLLRENMLATLAHSAEDEALIGIEGWLSEKEFAAMTSAPLSAPDGDWHGAGAKPEAMTPA